MSDYEDVSADLKLDEVKIVVVREAFSQESIP